MHTWFILGFNHKPAGGVATRLGQNVNFYEHNYACYLGTIKAVSCAGGNFLWRSVFFSFFLRKYELTGRFLQVDDIYFSGERWKAQI